MYREVNHRKFPKATLARLGSVMLLVVFAAPYLTAVAEEVTYSKLWGRNGELWSPTSRLPDLSYAGYSQDNHVQHGISLSIIECCKSTEIR